MLALEAGRVYEFEHMRKGLFVGRLISTDAAGWARVRLLTPVEGRAQSWNEGEEMGVRLGLCSSVKLSRRDAPEGL